MPDATQKSDIECVVSMGSSLFEISGQKHDFGVEKVIPWRAQRAIFSRILASWHLKTQNSSGLRAPRATHGQVLSSSGAKSVPRFLMCRVLNTGPRVYTNWQWVVYTIFVTVAKNGPTKSLSSSLEPGSSELVLQQY